jgi:tmRNA-binding protein
MSGKKTERHFCKACISRHTKCNIFNKRSIARHRLLLLKREIIVAGKGDAAMGFAVVTLKV